MSLIGWGARFPVEGSADLQAELPSTPAQLAAPDADAHQPLLDTPIAHRRDLSADSIVIYPELVRGNPLKARNVVRWLLYKPNLLHPFSFGPEEMFFRAGGMSDVLDITGGAPDLYLWKINPAYQNENRPDRKGVCYMVRKGKNKPRIPETEAPNAIQIDSLSHAEINEIFNRCDTFYSYDEATMYSQFAAICGCTSIVIPGMFSSREEWAGQHPNGRFGIAYGTHPTELEHARTTRHLLLKDLQRKEEESLETVRNFVNLTHQRFLA
ncbi:hypothetical protein ACFSYD_25180 [Paracoccus aerius]